MSRYHSGVLCCRRGPRSWEILAFRVLKKKVGRQQDSLCELYSADTFQRACPLPQGVQSALTYRPSSCISIHRLKEELFLSPHKHTEETFFQYDWGYSSHHGWGFGSFMCKETALRTALTEVKMAFAVWALSVEPLKSFHPTVAMHCGLSLCCVLCHSYMSILRFS